MAAPEPEAKPEAVTPSPSREPPPETEPVAPAASGSQELQPWEQHAAVIYLPRYDYRASGSLLLRSHSGFLITCPISASPVPLFRCRVYFPIEPSLFRSRGYYYLPVAWICRWIHAV
jgi:hypothetical protein